MSFLGLAEPNKTCTSEPSMHLQHLQEGVEDVLLCSLGNQSQPEIAVPYDQGLWKPVGSLVSLNKAEN